MVHNTSIRISFDWMLIRCRNERWRVRAGNFDCQAAPGAGSADVSDCPTASDPPAASETDAFSGTECSDSCVIGIPSPRK